MITFPAAVGAAIRSVQCALLDDNEYIVGSVGRFAGPVRQRALDGINATRDLLGCPSTPPIAPPDPEFPGGQCPIFYDVDFVAISYNREGGIDSSGPVELNGQLGPIQGVSYDSACALPGSGPLAEGAGGFCAYLTSGSGRSLVVGNGNGGVRLTITAVTPSGGGPDNCGSLPPVYPPPVSRPIDIDVTYNIDEGTEVTVNIPFIFAPVTVDFNGNFRIPVTFDFGGNEFSANFPLDVSIPVTINFPGLNPGDGQPTDTLPPGDPEDEVEPLPPGEKIIGVVVNSSINPNASITSIFHADMPETYAPRAGTIKFAYSLGSATFWSNDIDIKGDRVFIPCPFSQGADAVVSAPAPGVVLSFVPIKGFALATVNDVPRNA